MNRLNDRTSYVVRVQCVYRVSAICLSISYGMCSAHLPPISPLNIDYDFTITISCIHRCQLDRPLSVWLSCRETIHKYYNLFTHYHIIYTRILMIVACGSVCDMISFCPEKNESFVFSLQWKVNILLLLLFDTIAN